MPSNKAPRGAMAALTSLLDNTRALSTSSTAFGSPVTSGSTTVVPVARVSTLSTMGGGTGNIPFFGGDGAGGLGYTRVRPSGFLVVSPDCATYRPIRQPAAALAIPLALITAVAVTRIVTVSVKEARRRKQLATEQAQRGQEGPEG
ncbi:spore germination protein GerW family protein [Nocardiopsis exhalans]|uniref:Spore germination protein GerW family protein n=1 Tax=Nocardiopsis exhalans TaxID=163604 RepID=A0ABY5D6G6_9ACTN|nr:spore germination protein GerW family protein [Nocardiopsis exhalans]USY19966.1 spore germination protein GerW family protein [Nocardiopsis exhalans]